MDEYRLGEIGGYLMRVLIKEQLCVGDAIEALHTLAEFLEAWDNNVSCQRVAEEFTIAIDTKRLN